MAPNRRRVSTIVATSFLASGPAPANEGTGSPLAFLPTDLYAQKIVQYKYGISDELGDAAVAAELETGDREVSIDAAKSHIVLRVVRMSIGAAVVLAGLAMMLLPGPGVLAIAGGLFILAKDVAWADRLLQHLRKKVPGIPEDGKIPRSQIITMSVMGLGAVAASAWWFLLR